MMSRKRAVLLAALIAATMAGDASAAEKTARSQAVARKPLPARTWKVEQSSIQPRGAKQSRTWTIGSSGSSLSVQDLGGKTQSVSIEASRARWLRDRIASLSVAKRGEKTPPVLGSSCPNRIALTSILGSRAYCFDRALANAKLAELVRTLQEISP